MRVRLPNRPNRVKRKKKTRHPRPVFHGWLGASIRDNFCHFLLSCAGRHRATGSRTGVSDGSRRARQRAGNATESNGQQRSGPHTSTPVVYLGGKIITSIYANSVVIWFLSCASNAYAHLALACPSPPAELVVVVKLVSIRIKGHRAELLKLGATLWLTARATTKKQH